MPGTCKITYELPTEELMRIVEIWIPCCLPKFEEKEGRIVQSAERAEAIRKVRRWQDNLRRKLAKHTTVKITKESEMDSQTFGEQDDIVRAALTGRVELLS